MTSSRGAERFFNAVVDRITDGQGTVAWFLVCVGLVLTWFVGLPFVRGGINNDRYELYINSATTIITFVGVAGVQVTQKREMRAMHAKMDALVRATPGAPECLAEIEREPIREIERVKEEAKEQGETHA